MTASPRTLLTVINDADYFARHRRHVAEAAARAGWRVVVAMPKSDGAIEPLAGWRRADIRAGGIAAADLLAVWQIADVLRRERPALVHAITLKAIVLTSLALRLHRWRTGEVSPLVATFPGLGYGFEGGCAGLMARLTKRLARAGCASALAWPALTATFETDEDRNRIVQTFGFPDRNTHVLRGVGLDLSHFTPAGQREPRPFTVLLAGRLLKSKGIGAFVEAARRPGAAQFRWLVAGWRYESPDALSEAEVEALRREPAIEFRGLIDDMPALFKEVDALVLPSTYPEGVPRILIEAAACAIPMIATDFPGSRYLVRHGRTGLILENASAQDILDAVMQLADMPDHGRGFGAEARRVVEDGGYDLCAVQRRFLDIFERASPPFDAQIVSHPGTKAA